MENTTSPKVSSAQEPVINTAPKVIPQLRGLNSLRFMAALWVVFSHIGFIPLPHILVASTGTVRIIVGLYHCIFSGPAAVMVFFVISGIVIHAPYRDGSNPKVIPFLVRRYLRILGPLVAAILIEHLLVLSALNAVVWSLYAELIYYSLYPLMLHAQRRVGWLPIVAFSTVFSVGLIVAKPQYSYPWEFTPLLTWVVGLPVWLLGCVVADKWCASRIANFAAQHRWALRAMIWFLSAMTVALHFHAGTSYTRTLLPFGCLSCLWIAGEIVHFNASAAAPNRTFEWAGTWSYSLYLVHPLIYAIWNKIGVPSATLIGYSQLLVTTLVVAFTFYLVIEWPSHQLARLLGFRLLHPK